MKYSGRTLDWMRKHGLAYYGRKPQDWKPQPKTFLAKVFKAIVMPIIGEP
jgi:hypothetical protein